LGCNNFFYSCCSYSPTKFITSLVINHWSSTNTISLTRFILRLEEWNSYIHWLILSCWNNHQPIDNSTGPIYVEPFFTPKNSFFLRIIVALDDAGKYIFCTRILQIQPLEFNAHTKF
jgi:hypothetical protein